MPEYLAASGLAPTARISKPSVVLNKNQYTSAATANAKGKPQLKRNGSGKKRGNSAVASMVGVTGRKPLDFIGPLNNQSLKRKAIQFIMIVFTTSCAPVFAFK